ncbi:MAG TPA: hypothetical protein VF928_11920 [Usitatibacteraceae bacterium]
MVDLVTDANSGTTQNAIWRAFWSIFGPEGAPMLEIGIPGLKALRTVFGNTKTFTFPPTGPINWPAKTAWRSQPLSFFA